MVARPETVHAHRAHSVEAVTVPLFDDIERTEDGPARYAEPRFAYWNRSARTDIGLVRALMEEWFARYPSDDAPELRARIRGDDQSFHSATFELLLHELLRRLGCSLKVHPDVPNSTKHPEFLVADPDGSAWYLEAIVASGQSKEEATVMRLKNDVYDALNDIDSPNDFLNIEIVTGSRTPLPTSKLKRFVRDRLGSEGPWRFVEGEWDVAIEPMPKSNELRGVPGVRPLGIQYIPLHQVKTAEAIREAVRTKAKRYGDLDLPYVIAVNALCEHVDEDDEIDALFGDDGPRGRAANGAWRNPRGLNTRVSAAFMVSRFEPWRLPKTPTRLYHHPLAARPYAGVLTKFPQTQVIDERLAHTEGASLGDILGVAPSWLDVE